MAAGHEEFFVGKIFLAVGIGWTLASVENIKEYPF